MDRLGRSRERDALRLSLFAKAANAGHSRADWGRRELPVRSVQRLGFAIRARKAETIRRSAVKARAAHAGNRTMGL